MRWTSTPSRRSPSRAGATNCRLGGRATLGLPAAPGCSPSRSRKISRLIDIADLGWPALGADRAGLAHRRHLQDRRTGRHGIPVPLDRRAAGQSMLPLVSCLVQDLERGDGRRQSLHGAAGRTDDLADLRARRRVHDLDARRAASGALRSWTSCWRRSAMRLQPGELLRAIDLPLAALRRRTAFRQISLSPLGRSGALVIGTLSPDDGSFAADRDGGDAAPDPLVVFATCRRAPRCARSSKPKFRTQRYYNDIHGAPAWRRHVTLQFAEEIRGELAGNGAGAVMSFLVNGKSHAVRAAARAMPAHVPARARLFRREERLRRRRLRRLHGAGRRRSGAFLPVSRLSRREPRRHDHRRPGTERRTASDAAGLSAGARLSMRLLHAGHDHDGGEPQPGAAPGSGLGA